MATTSQALLKPFERLKRLLQIDKRDIVHVYLYALLNGLVNLSLPVGIQGIINLINGAQISNSWVILVLFVLMGLALSGVFQLLQLRIVENISQRIFARASFEFAYRFPRIRFDSLYNYHGPELANRFFDTLTIQKGLSKILIDFSLASFQILAGLLVLSLYHPFFILFAISLIGVAYMILVLYGPKGLRTSLAESKYKYEVAHWLEEIARTRLSFKLVDKPGIVLDKMDDNVNEYLQARESHFQILINQYWSLLGFKIFISAGLLIIGSLLVFSQQMNIGQFVAAEIIVLLIINSIEKLIQSLDSIYDVLTALEKIGYVADMELDNEDGFSISDSNSIDFELNNVTYSFPGEDKPVLNNLSFSISNKESVLLKGPDGSGKSTLIKMLCGIIKPKAGSVLVNDINLNSIALSSYRAKVGFVLGNNEIFEGSIYQNITLGREGITLDDVQKALNAVCLHEDLKKFQEGLHTVLDPAGRKIPER
ncbi:MAG: ABC-type bacteriocin/lantibiotic exporter with double-glycine peptidase domain, partial [Limisphaerales bacterium]